LREFEVCSKWQSWLGELKNKKGETLNNKELRDGEFLNTNNYDGVVDFYEDL